MQKSLSSFMIFVLLFTLSLSATEIDSTQLVNIDGTEKKDPDKPKKEKTKKEKDAIRTGWTFGILPSVGFDSDLGFQFGVLSNIYYFGDGSQYPDYLHSLYVEAAYTTKRYGIFRFHYDSKYLIPDHHLSVDLSYLPDAMSDFFGYNGYQSIYNHDLINMYANKKDKKNNIVSEDYLTRAFYKFKRDIFRFAADIQGNIGIYWKWNVGFGVLMYDIGSVNIEMINKGKKEDKKLPERDGLFEKYQKWGIIKANETGGWYPYVRAGVTYDSRDRQQNPKQGIYTDFFLTYSAAFGNQKEYNNLKANYTFRHYIPVYKDYINFSYRLACQFSAIGNTPFYANSYWNTLFIQRVLYEGLGGGNTLRGIMRNRILSNGFAFANVEFRFKVVSFKIKKENFYIGLVPFLDAGMILQPYRLDETAISEAIRENDPTDAISDYFNFDRKKLYLPHLSAGLGLKAVMNDNFVLSVDWALPFNRQDNHSLGNIYVKIGYMF
jgi:hypothetical protein